MATYIGNGKTKWYLGSKKVKKAYIGAGKVYSAGNIVTYMVDTGVSYQEEADSDTSCLSPKTFTPEKSGWTFVGWREDTTASGTVLTSKVMGDDPVTLYAVYSQTVTQTFKSYGSTQTVNGTRYYNGAGNTANASVTAPSGAAYSGWTWRGWGASGVTTNGNVAYANGATITNLSAANTYYGLYQQTVTVTYYNGSTTASSTSGYRYYNSYGNVTNPSFTLTQKALSGWTARGWSTSTAGNGSITVNNGAAFTQSTSITLYGMYQQTITLSYNGNGATSGSTAAQTGTRYYNSNGNAVNPSFTLSVSGFAKTYYTFSKWALGSVAGTQYVAGSTVTLSSSTVFYAVWLVTPNYIIQGSVQKYSYTVSGQKNITNEAGSDLFTYKYDAVSATVTNIGSSRIWYFNWITSNISITAGIYTKVHVNLSAITAGSCTIKLKVNGAVYSSVSGTTGTLTFAIPTSATSIGLQIEFSNVYLGNASIIMTDFWAD